MSRSPHHRGGLVDVASRVAAEDLKEEKSRELKESMEYGKNKTPQRSQADNFPVPRIPNDMDLSEDSTDGSNENQVNVPTGYRRIITYKEFLNLQNDSSSSSSSSSSSEVKGLDDEENGIANENSIIALETPGAIIVDVPRAFFELCGAYKELIGDMEVKYYYATSDGNREITGDEYKTLESVRILQGQLNDLTEKRSTISESERKKCDHDIIECRRAIGEKQSFVKSRVGNYVSYEPRLHHFLYGKVDPPSLKIAFTFFELNKKDAYKEIEKPLKSNEMIKVTTKEYAALVDNLSHSDIHDLVISANALNLGGLLDLSCAKCASLVKGKTVPELRVLFGVEDDLSPEKKAELKSRFEIDESI